MLYNDEEPYIDVEGGIIVKYLFQLDPDDPRVRQLCLADDRMAMLAKRIGRMDVPAREDVFATLAKSLIGQQLSVKAAETICRRVEEKCGGISPESVLSVSEEDLREAGVSRPKIGYVKGLADLVSRKELDFDSLQTLHDDRVVEALTKVKGIGRWTAEMFLIFHLGREDVLSLGDAGLRRAACWLYEQDAGSGAGILEIRSEQWKPYRSIASLYLWEAINRGHVSAGPARES
jgi:DNA-3-methyladenine glycosylase II